MSKLFDPIEIFRALARNEVSFVTVGGIAVQAHGGQRMTRDLDIVIATSSANLERLAAALTEIDARIVGPAGKKTARVPNAAMLGSSDLWHLETDYGFLDVMTLPAGAGTFEEMDSRAIRVALSDVTIPISSKEDLITLKSRSHRSQDIADVRLLESLK